MKNTTKKYYAVKTDTPFGTYTLTTSDSKTVAEEYATALRNKGRTARVVETDGVYNGPFKLA